MQVDVLVDSNTRTSIPAHSLALLVSLTVTIMLNVVNQKAIGRFNSHKLVDMTHK